MVPSDSDEHHRQGDSRENAYQQDLLVPADRAAHELDDQAEQRDDRP